MMKKIITGLLSLTVLILVLIFPQLALKGASEGLLLWFHRIVPALLPCMILTRLCIQSGILEKAVGSDQNMTGRFSGLSGYGLYAALLGLLCGFPMGAKLVHDFYMTQKISRREATFLLAFCNQISPAFLMEYVLTDHFTDEKMRRLVLLCYYMSLLLFWLILRWIFCHFCRKPETPKITGMSKPVQTKKEVSQTFCLSENLDTSIMNSLETILRIGGYIILFSVLAAGLQSILHISVTVNSILVSLLEITTGLGQIESCSFSPALKGTIINSLCAFGGLSSLMQVCGVLNGTELPVRVCFIAKAGQAVLTGLMTGLFFFLVL